VEARHRTGKVGVGVPSAAQRRKAVQQRFRGIRNERRTQPGDPMPPADGDDVANVVAGEMWRREGATVATVDLQIEQSRRNPGGFEVGRGGSSRGNADNAIAAN